MSHDLVARSQAAPAQAFGGAISGSGDIGNNGRGGLEKLEFLEYVSCALWYVTTSVAQPSEELDRWSTSSSLTGSGHDFFNDGAAPRTFWMMSCGHILCDAQEHGREPSPSHLSLINWISESQIKPEGAQSAARRASKRTVWTTR